MFDNLTREQFRIDTIFPAIQTAAVLIVTQILGRLGQYSVSLQTTALVTITASLTSSLAQNIFNKAAHQYASIPFGVAVGITAHRFFYPRTSIRAVFDVKSVLILLAALSAVKLGADNLYRLRSENVEEASSI